LASIDTPRVREDDLRVVLIAVRWYAIRILQVLQDLVRHHSRQ
jgi:hypothetical protein